MRVTEQSLRRLVRAELASLHEDMFNYTGKGSERNLKASGSDKWRRVSADAKMVAHAAQQVLNAALDQDEEATAKWIQKAEKFAKSAYTALLPEDVG